MSGLSTWLPADGLSRLRTAVAFAWGHSPAQRERLAAAGIDPGQIGDPEAFGALPILRKEALGSLQAADRPFGGLLGGNVGQLARIFLSPGEIYDPQGAEPDYWRISHALQAAGFGPGDRVVNCFSYHLTPAGFMFDSAARALGCVVIPGGVGQQDLQVRVMAEVGVTGYVGLPSYLLALLEKAEALGRRLAVRRAVVTGEPLPPALRERLSGFGILVYQAYATADLGLIGFECGAGPGLHLDDGVVVEICDPDGRTVPVGDVGEVVVTLLNQTYPLLRVGTGDLSAMIEGDCPCGRSSVRLRGWLGRANDVAKVRGMFLYPRQLEEAMARLDPEVSRWQAVVDRDEHHRDLLRIEVEGRVDPAAVRDAVRAATRLNPEVALVPPGAVPVDGPRLQDRRKWD